MERESDRPGWLKHAGIAASISMRQALARISLLVTKGGLSRPCLPCLSGGGGCRGHALPKASEAMSGRAAEPCLESRGLFRM
jgi:hypothetical protein